ncbi:MAG: methylglyoxal synthase [Anaerolineales bacterium]|nr:methylglyoxal synthase [Anaerolineales bacterium]
MPPNTRIQPIRFLLRSQVADAHVGRPAVPNEARQSHGWCVSLRRYPGRFAQRKDTESRMTHKKIVMVPDKKIALVAHDNKKRDLLEWARFNRDLLAHHEVYATGTTGETLEQQLGFKINKLQSGPLGGDQQIGAKIVNNEIDFLIFFWDPLEPQPHDPDVKALLRMAVVWNIPIACNRASADFMISSPLMEGEYNRLVPDYDEYRTRRINWGEQTSIALAGSTGVSRQAGANKGQPKAAFQDHPSESVPGQVHNRVRPRNVGRAYRPSLKWLTTIASRNAGTKRPAPKAALSKNWS